MLLVLHLAHRPTIRALLLIAPPVSTVRLMTCLNFPINCLNKEKPLKIILMPLI